MKLPQRLSVLLGAPIGDMIGSYYEYPAANRTTDFNFALFPEGSTFTDDTVLTIAHAKYLLDRRRGSAGNCGAYFRDFFNRYPKRGYGKNFAAWCEGIPSPNGFGNGASMRVSPAAYVAESGAELADLVKETTVITHSHRLALDNAVIAALAVFEARRGADKAAIRRAITGYLSSREITPSEIKEPEHYHSLYVEGEPVSKSFPSVPQAIACFLYTASAEDALRRAVACGKDADTQAAIAGSIAFPFYRRVPRYLLDQAPELPSEFMEIIEEFSEEFQVPEFTLF